MLSAFGLEVAQAIVDVLLLEIAPDEIDPDAPLFSDGLGLDSIDMLELGLMISKRYGVQFETDNDDFENIFANLRNLVQHIEKHRTK